MTRCHELLEQSRATMCAGFPCGFGKTNSCPRDAHTGCVESGTLQQRCTLLQFLVTFAIFHGSMTLLQGSGQKRRTRIEQRTFSQKIDGRNLASQFHETLLHSFNCSVDVRAWLEAFNSSFSAAVFAPPQA